VLATFPRLALIPPNKEVLEQIPQELQRNILERKVGPWNSSSKWIFLSLSSVTVGVTLGTLKVAYEFCMMSLSAAGGISAGEM